MCIAVAQNDIKRINLYIESNYNISIGDFDGRTPLHIAYGSNNESIVKLLIEKGNAD